MLPIDVTPKNPNKFECNCCNYITSNKKDYNKHLLTRKHNAKVNENINESTDYIICENCNKQYKSRVGLWQHQKKCPRQEPVEETQIIHANINIDLLNENIALKESLIKQSRQIHEMEEYTDILRKELHFANGFLRTYYRTKSTQKTELI